MSHVYFTCKWILGSLRTYYALGEIAALYGCAVRETETWPRNHMGFEVLPLAWQLPSANTIVKLMRIMGNDQLIDWKPCSEDVFQAGTRPITKEELWSGDMAYVAPRWVDGYLVSMRHNLMKEAKLYGGKPPTDLFWFV